MSSIRLGTADLETAMSCLICHKWIKSETVLSFMWRGPGVKHNTKLNLESQLDFFVFLGLKLKQIHSSLRVVANTFSGGLVSRSVIYM